MSIDEVITRAILNATLEELSDFQEKVKIIKQSIPFCSDKEIIELSNLQMPEKEDKLLSFLLQKQNEKHLTDREEKEFWELMKLNRLTTLREAFGQREVFQRGLII